MIESRIHEPTGEVLTLGHGRLPDDPPEIITHSQASYPDRQPEWLIYRGGRVISRSRNELAGLFREQKIEEAHAEASRRRNLVLASLGTATLADFLSLTARAVASVRREAKGRPNAGEAARLDQLEALADEIEAIDSARDTIVAEIRNSPDPESYDVTHSPHWPSTGN